MRLFGRKTSFLNERKEEVGRDRDSDNRACTLHVCWGTFGSRAHGAFWFSWYYVEHVSSLADSGNI